MQFSDDKPIWRQIYELIAMRILSGEWPEGERIVSVREMAQEEFNDSKSRIEKLTEDLKILLLPKDPDDDRNVIMEIKYGNYVPTMVRKITDIPCKQLSVSKYALCREAHTF